MKNIFKKKTKQQTEQAVLIMDQIEEGAILEKFKVKMMTLEYLRNADSVEQMELIQKYTIEDVDVDVFCKKEPNKGGYYEDVNLSVEHGDLYLRKGNFEFIFDLTNDVKKEYKLYFDIKKKLMVIEFEDLVVSTTFHYLVEFVAVHNFLKPFEQLGEDAEIEISEG